ncbi:MAG: ROK family glucokinase [bacterium]|nr:ROK family glucokinase [bacterium]
MYCVGVDIGGTTVKMGLFKVDGTLIEKWEIKTRKDNAGARILLDVSASIHNKLVEKNITNGEVKGIGIGVPGPVTEDGTVLKCANLGWDVFNVAEQVTRLTGIKNVKVGNDANVAALGEMFKGGGQGYKSLVMITLGTGVGGGVIINNKMLTGSKGAAGEIGHIMVNYNEPDTCGCGKHGCLEQYASATGIVKEAKRLLAKTEKETPLRDLEEITAKDIFDYAKNGDPVANELVEQLGWYLGLACAQIAQVVDPEAFVIGGGVSKAGTILVDVIKKNYSDKVMFALKEREFCLATLGNDAGIYGSAYMVIQ